MANLNQLSLLSQSKVAEVYLKEDHELVHITDLMDWDKLILIGMNARSKVKKEVGPQPKYRELMGAVVLMSLKKFDYRQAEDMIAHYAPARYMCDLMDSTWQPDHVTIFDFTKMLGPKGMEAINREVLMLAKDIGFLDPKELMSDTTAQEAKIPYPTEVGLMSDFVGRVKKQLGKAGKVFTKVKLKVKEVLKKVKGLVRSYHLFSKDKKSKIKNFKETFLYGDRNPGRAEQSFWKLQAQRKQSQLRAPETVGSDGNFTPSNETLYRDRVCCEQKDYSPEDVRTLRNRSRKSWQENRVWLEMGNQQSRRWFCKRVLNRWRGTLFRYKVLSSSCERASEDLFRNLSLIHI